MSYNDEITLEEIMQSRENRADKQKKLISEYKLPLISFTVNMPGALKRNPISLIAFKEGYDEIRKVLYKEGLIPVFIERIELKTGSETYIVVDINENKLKELTLRLENSHPLGRLWDFDIIGTDGASISREKLNYPRRKCFICEEEAHACARSRKHSVDGLVQKVNEIVTKYMKERNLDSK